MSGFAEEGPRNGDLAFHVIVNENDLVSDSSTIPLTASPNLPGLDS